MENTATSPSDFDREWDELIARIERNIVEGQEQVRQILERENTPSPEQQQLNNFLTRFELLLARHVPINAPPKEPEPLPPPKPTFYTIYTIKCATCSKEIGQTRNSNRIRAVCPDCYGTL